MERYPDVQKILAAWTGKEMPGLQAASVAVCQLVGAGILTFRLRGRCQLQLACSSKSPVRSGGIGRGFARDAPTWHERRTRKLATLMLASLFAIGRTGMGLAKGQGASGLPLMEKPDETLRVRRNRRSRSKPAK